MFIAVTTAVVFILRFWIPYQMFQRSDTLVGL